VRLWVQIPEPPKEEKKKVECTYFFKVKNGKRHIQ
jgi:hypothetical protein